MDATVKCELVPAPPLPSAHHHHHHTTAAPLHLTIVSIANAEAVARALATAANAEDEQTVVMTLVAPSGTNNNNMKPFPEFDNRSGRDEARRLLDLAAQRITPPLDARQYATSDRIHFAEGGVCMVSVSPTRRMNEGIPLRPHRSMFDSAAGGGGETAWLQRGDKRRLRVAGLLAAALMCDAWSEHRAKDCVDAATKARRPVVHIEPKGIGLTLRLVAAGHVHGYVAARSSSAADSTWRVVAVIPIPLEYSSSGTGRRLDPVGGDSDVARPKRPRSGGPGDDAADEDQAMWAVDNIEFPGCLRRTLENQHGKLVVSVLPAASRPVVEIVAYRLVVEPCAPGTAVALITAEDCHVVSLKQGDTATEANTITDLVALARESSKSVLERVDAVLEEGGGDKATAEFKRLRKAMLDSMSVAFAKPRGGGVKKLLLPRPLLGASCATPVTPGFEILDDESAALEFKYHLAGEDAKAAATMTGERLRRTIAAMASTEGGHILIGVADNGSLADRGALVSYVGSVRLGGFCPAMVKDAVVANELPLRFSDAPSSLPKDWWKVASKGASPLSPSPISASTPHASARRQDVVTMITVQQGTAPFYAPYRHGIPSMRGAASTLTMPTPVMVRRLALLLPTAQAEPGVNLARDFAAAAAD